MSFHTLKQHVDGLSYDAKPLLTGIKTIDSLNGIGMDDFLVLAGSSGSGKSTVALFMACNMAMSGKKVLYINTENSPSDVSKIIDSNFKFKMESDFGLLTEHGYPERFILKHTTEITYDEIHTMVLTFKPDVLFIDLFSCMLEKFLTGMEKANKTLEYAKLLSFYPTKYNCAVVVTEQLVKNNMRTAKPNMDDIAGGKGLSNKATKIITIYRYVKENMDKLIFDNNTTDNLHVAHFITELIVRKTRNGKLPINIYPIKYGYKGFSTPSHMDMQDYFEFMEKKKKQK